MPRCGGASCKRMWHRSACARDGALHGVGIGDSSSAPCEPPNRAVAPARRPRARNKTSVTGAKHRSHATTQCPHFPALPIWGCAPSADTSRIYMPDSAAESVARIVARIVARVVARIVARIVAPIVARIAPEFIFLLLYNSMESVAHTAPNFCFSVFGRATRLRIRESSSAA